jgi:5'-nucleotidase
MSENTSERMPREEAAAQVTLAKAIATAAHDGQVDKLGLPYIGHPARVAATFNEVTEPIAHCAGWLHDVIEDNPAYTSEVLRERGVHDEVIEIVQLMTRDKDAPKNDDSYYLALAAHPIAHLVKLSDITDNTAPWRTMQLEEDMRLRLAGKYAHARAVLGWKPILYIDLDNTLVNFASAFPHISAEDRATFKDDLDEVPGIFALMQPLPDAIEAFKILDEKFDTYILSTAPWLNPTAWHDKVEWVQKHIGKVEGEPAYKRLIISHHKDLNRGDYLIDDRPNNGAEHFRGEWIQFGVGEYATWHAVTEYLLSKVRA